MGTTCSQELKDGWTVGDRKVLYNRDGPGSLVCVHYMYVYILAQNIKYMYMYRKNVKIRFKYFTFRQKILAQIIQLDPVWSLKPMLVH